MFCDFVFDYALIDLGFSGYCFTWNNKTSGRRNIQIWLDHGLANSS